MKTHKLIPTIILITALVTACAPLNTPSAGTQPAQPTASAASSSAVLDLVQGDGLLSDLYERVNPGVVSIRAYSNVNGDGAGSGFVYDAENGYILTNEHVTEGANELEVVFHNGLLAKAELVASDPDLDISVIQVLNPPEELTELALGSSAGLKVGQSVISLGNPFQLAGSMSLGIVSAIGRSMSSATGGYFTSVDLIQTDAAINQGNSGGPLLNLAGEVIGINRAIRTINESATGQALNSGVGLSIPIDIVKRVVPALIKDGKYAYPYLGISGMEEMTLPEWEALGFDGSVIGAYVNKVTPGGPAEKAGVVGGSEESSLNYLMKGGDVITAVDGKPVRKLSDLISYILTYHAPGDSISLSILRGGEPITAVLVLGNRPAAAQ